MKLPASERRGRDGETLSRRSVLGLAAGVLGAGAASALTREAQPGGEQPSAEAATAARGRLAQSVCKWCYPRLSVAELATAAARLGLRSVELLDPKDFPAVQEHGLVCAMVNTHPLHRGLADPANHEDCLARITSAIEAAAAVGFPNVITFSGNRKDGISDAAGLQHCVTALGQVTGLAERKGVTICLELLNSKVDHPGYMADRTRWGVDLVERVGSERFKLLYDIYHMQIMEGDVIRTIREHHAAIGHYHTAGVPGRHELDENQELHYPAIVRAIRDTGYQGFLGQELIPTATDPLASLAQAVRVCDV
jgi:hydroxypyruvate isomerase